MIRVTFELLPGHGRADKAMMINAATIYGFEVKDEHQADAVGVWAFAVNALAPKHAGRFALGRIGARA